LFLNLINCNRTEESESLRIKKLVFGLFSLITLNGCIESTAFIGPAITVGSSGNAYQASISYATNKILYDATGKTTIQHVTTFLDPKDEFEGDLNLILKDSVKDVKKNLEKVIDKKKKDLLFKEKKVPEPILSSRLENFNFSLEDQFVLF